MNARLGVAIAAAVIFGVVGSSHGQRLIDDFNDGNDDGWTHIDTTGDFGPGIFDASSGSYNFMSTKIVPMGSVGGLNSTWDASSDPFYSDGFMRATVRANNDTMIVALLMRADEPAGNWYWFGANAVAGHNRFFYHRSDCRRYAAA